MMKYKPGDTVYWIEPPSSVRSGEVIRIAGTRYIIRKGYEAGVSLPESRLYPNYDAAAATLPAKAESQRVRKGHWSDWVG